MFGERAGFRRDSKKTEAIAGGGREIARMGRRRAVRGELGSGIGAPEAVEFEAGELIEGDGSDSGIPGEDGFAGGVTGGDDAADVHGGSLGEVGEGYNKGNAVG